ncbi:HEPN domain-containing protein [uncultured Adlercreutzia sp.]|uniref:HEPN domain-containing protein n=1 Tax=uncultured Adlercreutzia sp. TaxID=875803 RepID=UPI0025F6D018|nr:HEPN domain-containing protein [uncultured Adlercreutzia sp.]
MASERTGFLYAAGKDVQAIEALAADGVENHCEIISFLSQQAAEKMVKSIFVKNGVVPNKTHNVDDLLATAIENEWLAATETAIDAASNVSMHAVAARYTQMPDITRGEALQAIADCNAIAKLLADNGYDFVQIEVEASYLHDESESEEAVSQEG